MSILWWRRIFALTQKELLQFSRDLILVLATLYFFTGEVFIGGKGVSFDLINAPMGYMDHDQSLSSREWLNKLRQPYFDMKGQVTDEKQAQYLLDEGLLLGVLDIPENFERNLLNGVSTSIGFQLDASNVILGNLADSYVGLANAHSNQEWMLSRLKVVSPDQMQVPAIEARQIILYNPDGKSSWFMSISEMMTVLSMLSLFLTAAILVKEKERGTIEQLSIAPLTPFQILLPKILAVQMILLSGIAMSLFLIVIPVFEVPFQGEYWLFFLVSAVYIYAMSGLGIFIATISKNLAQVMIVSILLIMPIVLLSGAFTPPEAMPEWEQPLIQLSPLYYYINMGFGIILKGNDLSLIWQDLLSLFAIGSVLFLFGIWLFHRQFER
ncbi:ABC transporter permease [Thiomicrorhabdus sp. 6S3-12]|uniref:ABC transporter permease n=1 Tax=Thiomicrorhabdus sp. 6S3-12 TaxID=2819681 RepID=UPI001AADD37B|nr:ABC transporter permease [Thiomicrorhabdus sp. 6S3-12]MBO1923994.1 ABC transporter permease [Thiomicrorhabdus sp. 6S3-12]